jgi:hypothetical protein
MQIYFETLAETIEGIKTRLFADRIELTNPAEIGCVFAGHLNYGNDRSGNFEIASLRGKSTKKWFHAQIYRMDSGRYELTTYVL